MRRAEVVTTHMAFPANFVVRLRNEAVFETFERREWRVVGGTMSLRAAMRSRRDSSTGEFESTEEREREEDVRDDEWEA